MNYHATTVNCLTSGYPEGANLPVYLDSDRKVMDAALAILGTRAAEKARVMHIRNTMWLEEVEVSEPCLEELPKVTEFEVIKGPYEMNFAGDDLAAI